MARLVLSRTVLRPRHDRRRQLAAGLFVAVAAVPALSGCGGDAGAASSATEAQKSDIDRFVSAAAADRSASAASASSARAAGASGASSATAASTGAPATSATAADFTLPEAAKAHTQEGAKAFVRFYWEMLGKLDAHPQTGVIERFAAPGCTSCQMQIATSKTLVEEKAHVETAARTLTDFQVRKDSLADYVIVTFRQQDSGGVRVAASGERTPLKANDLNVAARADWDGSGWKLGAAGADQR